MRFKKIEIKNYKGINHLIIDFDKQPLSPVLTLVGLNESGKTSILEAINLLSKVVPQENRHELIPKNKKINFNDNVSVKGTIQVTDEDNNEIRKFLESKGYDEIEQLNEITINSSYRYVNSNPFTGAMHFDIDLKVKKKRAKKSIKLFQNKEDANAYKLFLSEKLIPKILYYPNFLYEFPNQIIIGDIEGNLKNTFYTEIVQDILHSIDSNLSVKSHLLDRLINDKKADREALDSTLNKMSAVVTSKVFSAWGRLFKVGRKEIVISPGSRENEKTNITEYYLEFKLKEGSDKFNISERSLGFKWFFTFLLFTEFRTNRATEKSEILFLLDEPASNLHSTAQKNLIETFKEISAKSKLVYTTHSHHLINPQWLNGAYIVRNKAIKYDDEFNYDSTNTDIEAILYKQFVSKYPNDTDYFQPILDILDVQPGMLEKVPQIVVTEGKNDFYALRLVGASMKKNSYPHIFPGTGVDKLYDIISLYLSWGKEFIVLLDSDQGGKKAKIAYQKEFGIAVADKIFLIDEIESSWKNFTMENLFDEIDRLEITKKFDPLATSFDKGKFNTSLQSLYASNENPYKFHQNTMDSFTKVFDFINKKLNIKK